MEAELCVCVHGCACTWEGQRLVISYASSFFFFFETKSLTELEAHSPWILLSTFQDYRCVLMCPPFHVGAEVCTQCTLRDYQPSQPQDAEILRSHKFGGFTEFFLRYFWTSMKEQILACSSFSSHQVAGLVCGLQFPRCGLVWKRIRVTVLYSGFGGVCWPEQG